ncbi:nucleotidyl transferase AbiEii/AbiGii toxin family protein [Clostridiaceae bacterium HFYG-1003]|nr:nucleotidyl transferase AbiEii/AbiGii toxin family protein [Clostridiaceae bacterium HFYG-1003]
MLFHESKEFEDLIGLTSKWRKIPSTAIRKDYFITEILSNIATCEYRDSLVFKGGTSLSKCYPGSIERFSEDIDLTYIPSGEININAIEKNLKKIEQCLIGSAFSEKNFTERNKRNKSCYIWFTLEHKAIERVKLEIGSETKPHPFQKKIFNSYIQDYLESNNHSNDVMEFGLKSVTINVLNIERTFLDKVMAVKRHA